MLMNENWYVIYTIPRWEKKVNQLLTDRGFTTYCPLNKVEKKWSDRRKIVEEPLFKGYVFVQIADAIKWEVRKVNGVINFVHWLGKPAIVPQSEIDTIRKFMNEYEQVEITKMAVDKDSRVKVTRGILMHHEGIVIDVNGSQARVAIDSLGLCLTATFHKSNLRPMSGKQDDAKN